MKMLLRFVLAILACCVPLLAQHELESHPLFQQATELAAQNKYAESIATINQLIELKPDEAFPVLVRATFHKRAGDLVLFRKDLDQAAALAPNDISILMGVERMLEPTNHEGCERVLAFADSHHSKFPQSSAILYIRSRSKNCLGDFVGAYNDVSLAIDLDPRNTAYRTSRNNLLDRLGDKELALRLAKELISDGRSTLSSSTDPDEKAAARRDLSSAYFSSARLHELNGDLESALSDLTNTIEISSEEAPRRARLELYKKAGRFTDAITDISAIIESRKQAKALLLQRKSDPPLPASWQTDIDRSLAKILVERGDIYLQLERQSEAIADYLASEELDPSTRDDVRKKIISLGRNKF